MPGGRRGNAGDASACPAAAVGSGTASMTLDVYAGLWPDADDRARSAASAALAKRLDATADGLGTATSQAVR